jgi:DNA-binding transcriptional LysR family regulator
MDLLTAMSSFVTTVRTGSMSAAGRKLGVSPALVGQRIAALETHMETRLLNRSTRTQSLTEFGEEYFQQCIDILYLVAQSQGRAASQQDAPGGRLRITAPTSFGAEALMPALPAFRAAAPNVELDIVLTDNNLDVVAEGMDVAFRIGDLDDSGLIRRTLAPYRMMICAAPGYLETWGTPITPDDLQDHQAVVFAQSARRPWRVSRDSQTWQWNPISSITVNSGQAVRQAGCAGLGLILQPAILLATDVAQGKLIPLFEGYELPQKPMSLLYHRDRYMPPRLTRFIEFAADTFGPSRSAKIKA